MLNPSNNVLPYAPMLFMQDFQTVCITYDP